ncbi:MAG: exodeoxyribonuclease VII small subunit [Oscillospiraceae bacterium]|nr:exodeoxyribonuclease VII small subunit [Oscillospiraceae bacterium]
MKFEEGMKKLSEITEKLEQGGLSLEEAVRLYSEGAAIAAECKKELDQASFRISEFIPNAADTAEQS